MRHAKPVRCLIRENGKTGKPENETRLVGTVSNPDRPGSREPGQADVVRLETAPTGDESIYLFLEVIIVVLEDSGKEQKLCN